MSAAGSNLLTVVVVAPCKGPDTRVLDGSVRLELGCSFRVCFPEELLDIVDLSQERDGVVLRVLAKVHAELLEGRPVRLLGLLVVILVYKNAVLYDHPGCR
jgi:hypothetical protein